MSDMDSGNRFEQAAGESRSRLFGEFWQMLQNNKKWWLLPIVLVMLLIGVLALLPSTAVAPFIYTLF